MKYREAGSPDFSATHWSVVLSAARGSETPQAVAAMAELCRLYWYPLYAYVRRRNHDAHEAEDLTQEFFARLLAKNYLADVDRRKGKFRAFLLAAMKHFLADEWDRSRAQKRGGGKTIVPLDGAGADSRYSREPSQDLTPEKLYERQWAIAVLQQVLALHPSQLTLEELVREVGGQSASFAERDAWMTAMMGAMEECDIPEPAYSEMKTYFENGATFMMK